MADVIYINKQPTIPPFFEHIQNGGVPKKVTLNYIETIGFRSKNDRAILPILKALGFVDGAGVPTTRWSEYRDKAKSGRVLAAGIREAYGGLFDIYPDAHRKDNEAIRNYFASQSELSEATIGHAVRTFKTLVQLADFEGTPLPAAAVAPTVEVHTTDAVTVSGKLTAAPAAPAININIQLELPSSDDAAVYDALFESMRRNLIDVGRDAS